MSRDLLVIQQLDQERLSRSPSTTTYRNRKNLSTPPEGPVSDKDSQVVEDCIDSYY